MKKLNLIIALFLMSGLIGTYSNAQTPEDRPLLFGPEFTFEDDGHFGNILILIKKMQDHLIDGQPEGAKFENIGGHFLSPNGWSFFVTTDPGVAEITVSPMTAEEWEKFVPDIQDAIFVSAANMGMFPQDYLGGGHISVDIAHFENNPLLLRNFLADLINHNELFMGALNYDVQNSASPFLYKENNLNLVKNIFKQFDTNYRRRSSPRQKNRLLNRFLIELRDAFHSQDVIFFKTNVRAIRIQNELDNSGRPKGRIEIRGIRPQKSADMFLRQIRLLKGRIEYLSKIKKPIQIQAQVAIAENLDLWDAELNDKYYLWNPPVDPIKAIANFHKYVTESGEDWANHQDYLWPRWVTEGDLKRFNESLSCENLLN